MNQQRDREVILKFLGERALLGGPFGLLEVSTSASSATVEAALQRQLDRVAAHPHADSPEADDVILALHTAAAQLLDPVVRAELVRANERNETSPNSIPSADTHAAPVIDRQRDKPQSDVKLSAQRTRGPATEAYARSITEPDPMLESVGDPNAMVQRLLIGGAIAAIVLVLGVVIAIIALTRQPVATKPAATPGGLAGALGGATSVPSQTPQEQPTAVANQSSPAQSSPAQGQPSSPGSSRAPRAPTTPEDAVLIVRDLRKALRPADPSDTGSSQSSSPEVFLAALDRFRDHWMGFEVSQRRAALDAIVEYAYRATPDAARALVDHVSAATPAIASERRGAGVPEIVPATWSVGVLARLAAERELPTAVSTHIVDELDRILGQGRGEALVSFESGALAALRVLNSTLSIGSEIDRCRVWLSSLRAITGENEGMFERNVCDAIEFALVEAPEPDADQRVYDTISALVTGIRWRRDLPGRTRLLAWLSDERVSNADIRVVTAALATKSNAEGVDTRMILSIGATPDDRLRLRATYAKAWGYEDADSKKAVLAQWAQEARAGVASPLAASDPIEMLADAVRLARLSEAGRRLWLGDTAGAAQIMSQTSGEIASARAGSAGSGVAPASSQSPATLAPARAPSRSFGGSPGGVGSGSGGGSDVGDGAWSFAFLRCERSIPCRLEQLAHIDRVVSPIGPIDAGVLAQAACFASPQQVRTSAQNAVLRFVDDPAMIEAMLQELPDAPRVVSVAKVFENVVKTRLPPLSDAEWEFTTRRLLVERALAAFAAGSDQAVIDRLAALLVAGYVRAAGVSGSAPSKRSTSDRVERDLPALFARLSGDARGYVADAGKGQGLLAGVGEIERRRAGRLRIAVGPLQVFAAEQSSIVEVFALVVAGERSARTPGVVKTLDAFARSRREAQHVFAQIAEGERAMLALWLIRAGQEGKQ